VVLAAAAALALGTSAPALAVADGTPVPAGRYGFAVKLTMTDIPRADGSHYDSACSGALIAPSWVITAGHCFHDVHRDPVSGPVPYATTATIGRTDDGDTGGHVVAVVEDFQSPSNDIALARLASPVYDVAPLQVGIVQPRVGELLRIAGWGSLTSVNPVPATHLQTGQVKISSVADATVGVVGYAPSPTTSACLYDSGAPYFFEPAFGDPVLVSVENNGPSCPHDREETTSRVDTAFLWIIGTILKCPWLHISTESGER
jgi:secreted trypsin-like serine protease